MNATGSRRGVVASGLASLIMITLGCWRMRRSVKTRAKRLLCPRATIRLRRCCWERKVSRPYGQGQGRQAGGHGAATEAVGRALRSYPSTG